MQATDFIEKNRSDIEGGTPEGLLNLVFATFERTAIAFSGAEDVVLIDIARRTGLPFEVFCLDTGRLHAETYRYIERVREHFGIAIELLSPVHSELEPFVRSKGLFSFFADGHQECCGIRTVGPLRRKLETVDAWVTGQRRDQSPGTRASVTHAEVDGLFKGRSGPLLKVNPLAEVSSDTVWSWIRERGIPYNELHSRGYKSIGCEPCTRSTLPGQHEREGRWWWEEQTKKECGLHARG
jgi:phosphoadenosine phosphosulfate reductase